MSDYKTSAPVRKAATNLRRWARIYGAYERKFGGSSRYGKSGETRSTEDSRKQNEIAQRLWEALPRLMDDFANAVASESAK